MEEPPEVPEPEVPEPLVPEVPLPEVPEVLPDVPLPLVPEVPEPDVPEVELPEPGVEVEEPDPPVEPLPLVPLLLLPVSELPAVFCLQPAAPRAKAAAARTAVMLNLTFLVFIISEGFCHTIARSIMSSGESGRCASVATWSGAIKTGAPRAAPTAQPKSTPPHPGKMSGGEWGI